MSENDTDQDLPANWLLDVSEDMSANSSSNPTMGDVIGERMSRRDVVRGALATTMIASIATSLPKPVGMTAHASDKSAASFNFQELEAGFGEHHFVAEGYEADVLIRWGDSVLANAPKFDPQSQSAATQSKQFGFNNDFIGFIPINDRSDHGLLVVNHEFTLDFMMFPGVSGPRHKERLKVVGVEQVATEKMAHGGSVIEVKREDGKWRVVENSKFARRVTAETEMTLSGPAAGHELMQTSADETGKLVRGMINNCAGAVTPWGTWLTCEENFNGYFWNKGARAKHPQTAALKRYGIPKQWYAWGKFDERFDIEKEPNEVHRFGWVVEIDPFNPDAPPIKRTALGRFKHEGAANIVNKDGRFVVYQGDDQRFDYVYKFVTDGKVDTSNRSANSSLLDNGTLYVARYKSDGTGDWLALRHGEGPLVADNGFANQGDVVIFARLAADLLGATKMDRPEDVEANPKTNKVYVMLTNNSKRSADQTDKANPRGPNLFGHIIEMTPTDGDHAATTFNWEILVRCGDPAIAEVGATFNPATTQNGWFAMPDNCAVDGDGRLWIATDGNSPRKTGRTDGVWAMETEGQLRGTSKLFFRCPNGAELCGPAFTPDMETLFVAVQHPGQSITKGHNASFESPSTRWPDFEPDMPPRPSVVAITKTGGGKIAR